jgi:hypothetical protein
MKQAYFNIEKSSNETNKKYELQHENKQWKNNVTIPATTQEKENVSLIKSFDIYKKKFNI